jgi:hypothetical protein
MIDALRLVIFFEKPGTPTDDDLFGTNDKMRIRDQWRINKDKAALTFKQMGFEIRPSDISGIAQLKDMHKEGDVDVLELSAELGFSLSTPEKTTNLEARYWILLPVDPQSPPAAQSIQTAICYRRHVGKADMDALYETTLASGYEARHAPVTVSKLPISTGNPEP